MGLTRSTSGLAVRDDFSSDTTADYTGYRVTSASIAGGVLTLDAQNVAAYVHETVVGRCVTTKSKRTAFDSRRLGPILAPGLVSSAATQDYYRLLDNSAGFVAQLDRLIDQGLTTLLTTTDGYPGGADWWLARLYVTASNVVARFGIGTLAYSLTPDPADTTYSGDLYGGLGTLSTFTDYEVDYFDLRTAHTITCTGMTTGHYLRVSDGTTAAEAQESAGTATVDAGAVLFPLSSVQIRTAAAGGGTLVAELTATDYTDMGGGDAFAYSGGPTISASQVASDIVVSWS